ncbi:MAG: class I SAM-dependent methyltransferase [Gemmatimonadota bacterium]
MTVPPEAGAKSTVFRGWATRAFEAAIERNIENVEELLRRGPRGAAFLDLGCDDGNLTLRFASALGTTNVHGLELVEERASLAASRGVDVQVGDLNERLPYEDATFDVVCSHQVIEHLVDPDTFLRELFRILKPHGLAVTSTENLASWHNVAALLLGWQPFSLSNVTQVELGLGNPLSIHRGDYDARGSWRHVHVFSYRGLREPCCLHGFEVEAMVGAGYYPLPALIGRWDTRHAAFVTIAARRPGRLSR